MPFNIPGFMIGYLYQIKYLGTINGDLGTTIILLIFISDIIEDMLLLLFTISYE